MKVKKYKVKKIATGRRRGKFVGYYCKDGIKYDSAAKAAKATGEHFNTIKNRAHAGNNGWNFEPNGLIYKDQTRYSGFYCYENYKTNSLLKLSKITGIPTHQIFMWSKKNKNGFSFESADSAHQIFAIRLESIPTPQGILNLIGEYLFVLNKPKLRNAFERVLKFKKA